MPGMWKRSFFCGSGSAKILLLPHRLFYLKSKLAKKFCPFHNVGEVLLLPPDPFQGMGMVEDHETPEAGQLSRAWTRCRRETESHQ